MANFERWLSGRNLKRVNPSERTSRYPGGFGIRESLFPNKKRKTRDGTQRFESYWR